MRAAARRLALSIAGLVALTAADRSPSQAGVAGSVETRLSRAAARAGFEGVLLYGTGAAPAERIERGFAAPGKPHAATARWRWASVSKQLTALIVMQEVAAGRLGLDRPIRDYWPDWPAPYGDAITVRMLLQHSSGLPDPANDAPDTEGIPHFYRTWGAAARPAREAAGYCAGSPRAAPGSGFHYNNCDFIVLGALLERVTGLSFDRLIEERIARPLGLTGIGLFPADGPAPVHVAGRTHGRADPPLNLGTYGAAGAVYGAPLDLYRFDRALLNHRLLDPASTETMWTPVPALGQAALGQWAYDVTLKGCPTPLRIVERRGQIGGVQIRNFLVPARDAAMVAATARGDYALGEVWQGSGVSFDLLSIAVCGASR